MLKRTLLIVATSIMIASGKIVIAQQTDNTVNAWFSSTISSIDNRAYVLSSALWNISQIPVCWENPSAADESDRQLVERAIRASWQTDSCLEFTNWRQCEPNTLGIRIQIADIGPHTKGLGTQLYKVVDLSGQARPVQNGMVLNFNFQNWSETCRTNEEERKYCIYTIAVHEFGHALGFAHEQNRPDTPGECNKPAQGTGGNLMLTRWDPKSVMNYCNKTYNNNGILSDGDKFGLHKVYCKSGGFLGENR